jgi:hypothetical protein
VRTLTQKKLLPVDRLYDWFSGFEGTSGDEESLCKDSAHESHMQRSPSKNRLAKIYNSYSWNIPLAHFVFMSKTDQHRGRDSEGYELQENDFWKYLDSWKQC